VAPHQQRAHSHEVFHPLGATHPSRFTAPELCLPGSCCVLALTMCLDALRPQQTPWYLFNQVRPRDRSFGALPDRDHRHFSMPDSPLAIYPAVNKKPTTSICLDRTSTRLAAKKTNSSNSPSCLGLSLSGVLVLRRFWRQRHCYHPRASLQGFNPSVGWGCRRWISPRATFLAPLGLFLLGAFPFRASASAVARLSSFVRPRSQQIARGFPPWQQHAAFGLLSALRGVPPRWVLLPVLQSVKELRKLAYLSSRSPAP
jgi:hypothetical protein